MQAVFFFVLIFRTSCKKIVELSAAAYACPSSAVELAASLCLQLATRLVAQPLVRAVLTAVPTSSARRDQTTLCRLRYALHFLHSCTHTHTLRSMNIFARPRRNEIRESRVIRSGLGRLRHLTAQIWPFAQSVLSIFCRDLATLLLDCVIAQPHIPVCLRVASVVYRWF